MDRRLSRAASFWVLAALLAFFLFAASAPSPLYRVYQEMWQFSSITLTSIYAAYALGALAALLTGGRLSDHLGRRIVLLVALVVQIGGMLAFIAADGVGHLYAGRALQGVGTGIATGVISAWLLDLQPEDRPRLGGLIGGIALIGGLGAGAFCTGLLVQYGPDPLHLVFWLLALVFALGLAVSAAIPDVAQRAPGWARSMRPQISVPPSTRPLFVALAPSLIATWALGGLYLSLGPSLASTLRPEAGHIGGGLVIIALLGAGAAASAAVRASEPRRLVIKGSVVLLVGVAITLIAVASDSIVGLYAGSVVAGLGFGPAFSGAFRGLARAAPPDRRGALLAAVYVVIYTSFSVPTIIAGAALARYGLRETTYAYGLGVMALAAMTTIALSRQNTSGEAAV